MRSIVIKAMNVMTKKILAKYSPVIIGITGSFGKSSVRGIVYEILKKKYKVACNESEYKPELNIPFTVIGAEPEDNSIKEWARVLYSGTKILQEKAQYPDVLVLEMDVNRPNDMKKMLKVVRPNIGIFTGLGEYPSHRKHFKNEKHIAREKSLLIKSLGKKGLAVLNYDDEFSREAIPGTKAEIITYGFDPSADVRAEEVLNGASKWRINDGSYGMCFKISYKGTTMPFRLPYALGRGQIYSTLAATAVGIRFGYNLLEMSEILSVYEPLPGRMKLLKGIKGSMIIDDTFSANPGSMLTALQTLGKLDSVRKIAVVGGMLESEEYGGSGSREVGGFLPKSADLLITYGNKSKYIHDQVRGNGMGEERARHFEDMEKLVSFLKSIISSEDVVLVKVSREMYMENIVENIMKGIVAEPEKRDEFLTR